MPTTAKGTFERRKEMENMWCFQCSCILCRDPTEANTMFSALNCPVCEGESEGYLLPMDPLNPGSTWRCKICNFTQGINEINEQNDESNHIETAVETNNTDDVQNNNTNQNQIGSENEIKAIINPEIHNEIKL